MKQITCIIASLMLLTFPPAGAQDLLLKKAPPLQLKAMLQASGEQWKKLEGKITVLEFWATWCTPCMANLAHLNELSRHFADSNVQFISITREPEKLIAGFLQKRAMNGWVGIDSEGATFKNYGISAIPHTVVIDQQGIVQFSGEPSMLNEQIIREALAGIYKQPVMRYAPALLLGGWSPGDDPVFTANFDPKKTKVLQQTTIRQSAGSGGTGTKSYQGCVGINIMNRGLSEIIAFIDELPGRYRVINRSSVPDTARWDVIFLRSKGYDMPRAMNELKAAVLESFSIIEQDSVVKMNVLRPAFSAAAKVINEKDIDFDKPESHTLRSLKQVYDRIENENGIVVDYPSTADEQYIDIFDIMPDYNKMTPGTVKVWMENQGFTFRETQADVTMKIISSKAQ